MLKFKSLLIVLVSLAFVATACDKKQEASADEPAAAEEKAAEETEQAAEEAEEPAAAEADEADEKAEGEELAMVDVPKEGKKFDPAVEVEQIPAGAWYCDMGTVHYARMEEGDGACAECGMKLKQKAAGEQEAAGDQKAAAGGAEDHAGHDHN